jgi:anaerobic selenocysteine-containing dehydrogenase
MRDLGVHEAISFCRICGGGCGVRLTIDENDRICRIQGDHDQPMSKGYMCFKGLQAEDAHHGPARLLHPLKRMPDGSFKQIALETALDEIADKMRPYYAAGERDAIALFGGNGSALCSSAQGMHVSFMAALGSAAYYTTVTIDQSNKLVCFERLGGWAAGLHSVDSSEVALLFGANPLVSHSCMGFLLADPARRVRQITRDGLKLIVIDPRQTETARHAALMLQPIPGQDAAIAGGLIRIIIDEGWGDADFTARFATPEGMAALRQAVDPFTEHDVERRAGLQPGQLRAVAELFARDRKRGAAFSSTGISMSPFSNLAQHLIDCLNVVCGRYRRVGEKIDVDMLKPPYPVHEEVIPPPRTWLGQKRGRTRGVAQLGGERLTATLADEILTPGKGQIRCLFAAGSNPMSSVPDTRRTREAFAALDMLVVIDPYMTATAKHADYILPPKLQYERADLPMSFASFTLWTDNWTQYTPSVISPPHGSEVCDEWYPFWGIAKRLGFAIDFLGNGALPMDEAPATDDLLALRLKGARISLAELKGYPSGHIWNAATDVVLPGTPGAPGRFDLMPGDVAGEIEQFLALPVSAGNINSRGRQFSHLLSNRRLREVFCSNGTQLAQTLKRLPYNPAYLHPDDLSALGFASGDPIRITSDHGSIVAVAQADSAVRCGVVSLSHGWGGEPVDPDDGWDGAANVNLLIASDRDIEDINAMPRMSAIPVNLEKVNASIERIQ